MTNENKSKFVRVTQIQKKYDISNTQLRKWAQNGVVDFVKTPGGNRLYSYESIDKLFGKKEETRSDVIYCRVSSQQQKEDLERQIKSMQEKFPKAKIIKDIGSGINYKKPGFEKLVRLVFEKKINFIYISDKDRLLRFGYELFESMCEYNGTKIVVLYPSKTNCEEELGQDLLTIANVFVAKKNGQRAARNFKERKKEENRKIKEGTTNSN